jgi:LPXTG-motif cell wall-anchored protein
MLNYLNGVNNTNMNGIFDKFTTAKNNAIQKLPPIIKKAVDTGGKVAEIGVKIATTPMRLAFLGLVRVNALHVAENLESAIRRNRTAVLNWWKDFGGDFNELLEVTNLGIKAGESGKAQRLTGMGVVVATTTAVATATAVPITTSLFALLKNIGVEAVTGSAKALADQGKTALTNAITKGINLPKGVTPAVVVSTPKATTTAPTPTTTEATTEKKSNMPLIIGGIAVLGLGAFFLLKKKK